MFGGLRHRNTKAKGRANWLDTDHGTKSYPDEGTRCTRTAVNSVLKIMKFITVNTLTGPAYLEMLKNSFLQKSRK